jgi:tetratricopeptide (TPR) repeat protein
MKKIYATFIVFALLFSCASNIKKEDLSREYYNLGNAYFAMKKYKEANQFYSRAIELDPSFSKAKYNYAQSLIKNNEYEKSLSVLEDLRKDEPENISVLSVLGYIYHVQKLDEKASVIFEKILSISPDNTYALYNSGIVLWSLGKKEDAQKRFDRAIGLLPNDADILFNMGNVYLDSKDYSKAIDFFGRYLEKKPNDDKAFLLLARTYSAMEQYALALDAYEQAVTINTKLGEAWFEKAQILLAKVKDPDKGIVAFSQALDVGFNEKEKILALYNSPDTLGKDALKKILEDKSLLPKKESGDNKAGFTPEPQNLKPAATAEPAGMSPDPTSGIPDQEPASTELPGNKTTR